MLGGGAYAVGDKVGNAVGDAEGHCDPWGGGCGGSEGLAAGGGGCAHPGQGQLAHGPAAGKAAWNLDVEMLEARTEGAWLTQSNQGRDMRCSHNHSSPHLCRPTAAASAPQAAARKKRQRAWQLLRRNEALSS